MCPNGKKYVGITIQIFKRRWANGEGYRFNKHFYNAIKKYGWENIKHEIVAENLSAVEAKEMEVRLISEYKTHDQKFGYNKTFGGEGNIPTEETREKLRIAKTGFKASEETRKKMSESHIGDKAAFYGKHHSEEAKQKISEKKKGKNKSEEAVKKMSESMTGEKNPRYIPRSQEMIDDVLCGISHKDFIIKYGISGTTYYRIKKELL
jgi:group I intron endonuclease